MMLGRLLVVAIFGTLYTSSTNVTKKLNERAEIDIYRLPKNVIPTLYKVHVTIDFQSTKEFTATTTINLKVIEENVKEIVLHSRGLKFTENDISLTKVNGTGNNQLLESNLEPNQQDKIFLKTNILKKNAEYILTFNNYVGLFGNDMHGLYLSSYFNENNEVEYIATTQLQPTHARRVFPCFDEPNFKAPFDITITHPTVFKVVISNAGLKESTIHFDNPQVTTTAFNTTPKMSTYLVAFVVSKFASRENEAGNYRVFARTEAAETLKYGFEIGQLLLKKLDDYMDIPYSKHMNKLDQVAIPDFSAGAMENWGLITYRETALLWDEKESTTSNKQRVATVIAHEMTHMWFGDLVTMDWWSSTWLNEGFARYFQYYITALQEPSWELEKQFVIEQQQTVFATDVLSSALPLTSPVSTPAEIQNRFATISYNKGASVIRMVKHLLGEKNFKTGLQNYLKNNELQNTTPQNLWEALQNVVPTSSLPQDKNLNQLMQNWIEKSGYPLVRVSLLTNGTIILKQERFLLSGEDNTKWNIPVSYTTSKNKNFQNTSPKLWLLESQEYAIIENEQISNDDWIVVNVEESGYYRVGYDNKLWKNLEKALLKENFDGISEVNRAQIVDDVFNLARANKNSYSTAFDVVSFLQNDISYYPWYSAYSAFSFLLRRIGDDAKLGRYIKDHILKLSDKLIKNVPFSTVKDEHVYNLKQSLALQWACNLEHKDCTDNAKKMFENYRVNGTAIQPNFRSVVYCSALRQDKSDVSWTFLWNKFLSTKLATEQVTILSSLGCTQNEALLNEYLKKSITENSGIRNQDALSVFTSVYSGNSIGIKVAFDFFRQNHKAIINSYGSMNGIPNLVTGLAERFTTETQINELEKFYEANKQDFTEAANAMENAIENAKANIQWKKSHEKELLSWFTRGSSNRIAANLTILCGMVAILLLKLV